MNVNLPIPVKGQPITADWAAGVTEVCRRFGGMGSGGLLVREGVGGIGYETLPENKRKTRSKTGYPGCFHIVSANISEGDKEDDPKRVTVILSNPYYRVGGKTYEAELQEEGVIVEAPGILTLDIDTSEHLPSATLMTYDTLSSLNGSERLSNKYILPLYAFAKDGSVACDFRIGVEAAMFEFGDLTDPGEES